MQTRILATKYDGSPHLEWNARLLRADRSVIVCRTGPGTEVTHHTRQTTFHPDYEGLFIFPVGEWYNISLGYHSDGSLRHVYCNVAMPIQRTIAGLCYVDLDLDVLQFSGEAVKLDDEDDFAENSVSMSYPADVVVRSREAAEQLLTLGLGGAAPFGLDCLAEALRHYGCAAARTS